MNCYFKIIPDYSKRESLLVRPPLQGPKTAGWTLLQLHSISERLKSLWPPINMEDKRLDFTNVADACCKLETLCVVGSTENIGSSQLLPNQLKFDFLAFKSLRELQLSQLNISPEVVSSLGILHSTLVSLTATECGLKIISLA